MLHTKFRENQFAGSRGEDFWRALSETDLSGPPSFFWMFSLLLKELIFIFFIFTMYGHGGHLGHVASIILMDFYFHVPKGLHTNFG